MNIENNYEISFKAKSEEELFLMVENYYNSFLKSKGKDYSTEVRVRIKKRNFLEKNPVGTSIKYNYSNSKYFPKDQTFEILDANIGSWHDEVKVLVQGTNGKRQWKKIEAFTGYNPYDL